MSDADITFGEKKKRKINSNAKTYHVNVRQCNEYEAKSNGKNANNSFFTLLAQCIHKSENNVIAKRI